MAASSIAWSDPKILAALIAAGVSLVLGVTNLWLGQRHRVSLEHLKASLAAKASKEDARLEYEYHARMRLYQACAPIMFQLSNSAERARGRILSFALSARNGDISQNRNWLDRRNHGYYWASSYYRLLAPAAFAEILKRRLTHIDLSLDSHMHAQFELTMAWSDTFSQDFVFAGTEPKLPYDPHAQSAAKKAGDPRKYTQQGIPRGILENAAATLIEGEGDQATLMTYARFEALVLGDKDETVRPAILRVAYLLDGFIPAQRPVLWRMLCAQFAIAEALIELRNQKSILAQASKRLQSIDLLSLNWLDETSDTGEARQEVEQAMKIGVAYALGRIERIRQRLDSQIAA